jgi:chromosome segregation protein
VEREDAAARTAHAAAAAALVPLRAALEEATVEARDRSEALAGALREAETAQQEHDAARRAARELRERSELVRAQLGALKEHAEATNRLATRLVDRGWRPLLDALRAPEEAWAAIEAVIGGELADALLWRGDDPTPDLDEARGSARLLQLEGGTAAGRDAALTAVGGERTLAEWVGEDAPAILGRAVVARDPAALLAGWSRLPAGWLAVTLEGDLADARGVLVLRGRGDTPGGGAAREHQRRRELEEALERIVVDEHEGDATLSSAERRMREATASREAAQRARDEAERRVREAAAGVEGAESRLARAEREATRLAAELATAQHREAETRDEPASPAAAADQLETDELNRRAEAVRAARSGAVAERDAARQEWQAARSRVETLEAALSGARRRRGELELRIAQIEGSLPSQRSTLAATVDELDAARGEAERTRAEDDAAASARGAADAERERLRAELLELERGSRLGARLAELERNAQASAIEASRHDEALAALLRERELAIAGFVEEGEGEPGGALADPAAGEEAQRLDDAELETELRRVRRTLGQIGSVNPFAVQEHGELAARLEELETQDRDLRNASGSIQELIDRLDGEIVERFNTAFASIAERFDEFCRLLFAGGSASLQQVEGDQDAPGGIEITVRPPGKRPQRLAMLSGGERALTGVALLFAMLSVNPVPFCVLDEVDAALDEANIGRFADALRRLSETIDFVVITHNRATMEVADTIYGVTMTDAAVSRVLSLRLADIPVEVSA